MIINNYKIPVYSENYEPYALGVILVSMCFVIIAAKTSISLIATGLYLAVCAFIIMFVIWKHRRYLKEFNEQVKEHERIKALRRLYSNDQLDIQLEWLRENNINCVVHAASIRSYGQEEAILHFVDFMTHEDALMFYIMFPEPK